MRWLCNGCHNHTITKPSGGNVRVSGNVRGGLQPSYYADIDFSKKAPSHHRGMRCIPWSMQKSRSNFGCFSSFALISFRILIRPFCSTNYIAI